MDEALPSVFAYLDYRAFLRDTYEARKRQGPFSYRSFSRRAGLKSPNHLKRVIDGERRLRPQLVSDYGRALRLSAEEVAYLDDLVRFCDSDTPADKRRAYASLSRHRGYQQAQHLDVMHAEYFSRWYIPAIRELVKRRDFRDDARWIAERLVPRISTKEARDAMNVLRGLGLVEDGPEGVRQTQTVVSTGAETAVVHVVAFHRAMMAQAADSLDTVRGPERDVSSLTFCLDDARFQELKGRIADFRKELIRFLTLERSEHAPERVMQLNVQLFPLSDRSQEES